MPPFHFASNKGVVGPECEWRDSGKPVLHIDSQFSGVIAESVRVLQEFLEVAWRSLGALRPTASRQIEEGPLLKTRRLSFLLRPSNIPQLGD